MRQIMIGKWSAALMVTDSMAPSTFWPEQDRPPTIRLCSNLIMNAL